MTSIVEFNGKPCKNSSELVSMVTATAPGTTVPVKIMRAKKPMTLNVKVEELNIEAEQARRRRRRGRTREPDAAEGHRLRHVDRRPHARTLARRLALPAGAGGAIVSDVDQGGAAARRASGRAT